jgi:hypothetical protein
MRSIEEMQAFTDMLDERKVRHSRMAPAKIREIRATLAAFKQAKTVTLEEAQKLACKLFNGWGRIPGEVERLCLSRQARVMVSFWPSIEEAEAVARRIEREASGPCLKAKTVRLLMASAYCPSERQIRASLRTDPTSFSVGFDALKVPNGAFMVKTAVLCDGLLEDDGNTVGLFRIGAATEEQLRAVSNVMATLPLEKFELVKRTCRACGKASSTLLACATCRFAHYCDRGCQLQDWAAHKHICKFHRQFTMFMATMANGRPGETPAQRAARFLINRSAAGQDVPHLFGAEAVNWLQANDGSFP